MKGFAALLIVRLAGAPARAQQGQAPTGQGVQGGQPGAAVPSPNAPGPGGSGGAGPNPTERTGAGSTSGGQGGVSSQPILPLANPSPSSPQLYGPGDVIRHGGERRRKATPAPAQPNQQPGQVQPPPQPAAPTQPGQRPQTPTPTQP